MAGEQEHLPLASMATGNRKMHVAMFPWLAFGHIIPYLDLAKFIARKGHTVSFISTPKNIRRLPKLPQQLSTLIHFVNLHLPRIADLPEGAEATLDLHFKDVHYLKLAFDGLQPQLAGFLESSSPDWIIYDFAPHWLPPIAAKLRIPQAYFQIINAWFSSFFGSPSELTKSSSASHMEPEQYTTPPKWITFPTNVAFRLYEIKKMLKWGEDNCSGVSDWFRYGSTMGGCDVYAVRHCREFEPQWLNLLEDLLHKPVLPVGLMPPLAQDSGTDEQNQTWMTIKGWLHKQKKNSVVFIAMGSEVALSEDELTELALGLELSGLPFFWALRNPPGSAELLEGFEERIRNQGVVWKRWAPQLKILSHESVGGFLTHCGWSSIIEGLQCGLPLIMLPFMIDQGLNARVMEEKKVGVEIERDEDGQYRRESVAKSMRLVMVDAEGGIYRAKAREMCGLFGDRVTNDQYLDNFVSYLQTHGPRLKARYK